MSREDNAGTSQGHLGDCRSCQRPLLRAQLVWSCNGCDFRAHFVCKLRHECPVATRNVARATRNVADATRNVAGGVE